MLSTYKHIFPVETLKKQPSPIIKRDHAELDNLESISEEEKAIYMSMVGTAQWLVTLKRFDIAIAMSTLSLYRALQKGRVECMKQLYVYIEQFPMLLYEYVQTFLTIVKWYMNPTNGYS